MCSWWVEHNPMLIWNPYSFLSTVLCMSLVSCLCNAQAQHHTRLEIFCGWSPGNTSSTYSQLYSTIQVDVLQKSTHFTVCKFSSVLQVVFIKTHSEFVYTLKYCALFSFQKQPYEFAQNQNIITKSWTLVARSACLTSNICVAKNIGNKWLTAECPID